MTEDDINCIYGIYVILSRIKSTLYREDIVIGIIKESQDVFKSQLDTICQTIEVLTPHFKDITNKKRRPADRPKQRRANYPKHITEHLKQWLHEHIMNPYPSEEEKHMLSELTGLDNVQVNNWFINARRRILPSLRNHAISKTDNLVYFV